MSIRPVLTLTASCLLTISLTGLVTGIALSTPAQAASAKTKASAGSAPSSRHRSSPARRKVAASLRNVRDARVLISSLQNTLTLARNAEQSLKARHESQGTRNTRNALRQATVERANIENRLVDANQQLRGAQAAYRAAKSALRAARGTYWRNQTAAGRPAPKAGKARTLTFNSQPLGPTGSGTPRSTAKPKGILKQSGYLRSQ